jgi:hypothetical protein
LPEGGKGCVLTATTELHVYFLSWKEAFGTAKNIVNKCRPDDRTFQLGFMPCFT